jgi:transcriptional regulator with XRE-family HTH domain
LAAALGTDPVTVSRWERGVARPRPSALRRLVVLGMGSAPRSGAGFVEDPARRIRRLDEIVRDQVALKRRSQRVG